MVNKLVAMVMLATASALQHDIDAEFKGIMSLLSDFSGSVGKIDQATQNVEEVNKNSMSRLHAIEERDQAAMNETARKGESEFNKVKATVDRIAKKRLGK